METLLLLSRPYYLQQTLLMLASPSAYDPQKTIDIVSVPGSYAQFAHLSINRRLLTISFQFPTYCSTSLLILL